MKKRRATALFLLFLCLAGAAAPGYGATKQEADEARDAIDSLEEEKEKTEAAIRELESLKSDTQAYVQELDGKVAALDEELNRLAEEIAAKEESIRAASEDLAAAQETEETQYESMKKRIKYMYEKGESGYLEILLESGSISELLNRAEYISQISAYDREMLNRYAAVREEIAAYGRQLEVERGELTVLEAQTAARQESVQTLLDEKTAELNRVNAQIGEKTAQAEAYEADIQAQEERIRQIEEEIRRQEEEARKAAEAAGETYNTVDLGNISFIWPCPSSSRITSQFGDRESPTAGASSNHKGVDIGAQTGSDILAAAGGTVTISTYSYSAGNYIMINHGGGVFTVYMHCSQLLVSAGDTVEQGQVIAKVGSTGYSTGPHLHFGIRYNGNYVNPLGYVSP